MELWTWSKPETEDDESRARKCTIKSDITMLIGPNGAGKSTFLQQVNSIFKNGGWEEISKNDKIRKDYAVYLYDNVNQEKHAKSEWLFRGDYTAFASAFENSEGQDMFDFLYYKIPEIGNNVRRAKKRGKKGIFLLFDGLDSGLSLDILHKVKTECFEFIVNEENKTEDFHVWIIASANSFEFVEDMDCIDVRTMRHKKFTTYNQYKKYFLNNKS